MRAAARLIGRIARFGHVSDYMRDILHSLPFPQRFTYRISALVWRCLAGVAPVYLVELYCSTLSVQRHGSLRSSKQAELLFPGHGHLLCSAVPFLLMALQFGMGSLWICA